MSSVSLVVDKKEKLLPGFVANADVWSSEESTGPEVLNLSKCWSIPLAFVFIGVFFLLCVEELVVSTGASCT